MSSSTLCTCPEQLAMASVPKQQWCEPYDWCTALKEGTIFPCLNMPFFKAPLGDSNVKPCSTSPLSTQIDREEVFSELDCISFALNDLTLYLDTHPDCEHGLPLFYELLEQRLNLLSDCANSYYPLTQISMITGDFDQNRYGWPEGPMPWEGACI